MTFCDCVEEQVLQTRENASISSPKKTGKKHMYKTSRNVKVLNVSIKPVVKYTG